MSAEKQGMAAAKDFRERLHLGIQPLGDLVTLIEQTTGHDVAVLDAETDEHGLTMRDPRSGVVFIGVARTRNAMRQRSTLAHELAHVEFQDWSASSDLSARSPEEIRADAFARHLLIPKEAVTEHLGSSSQIGEAELSALVQRYLVSPAIAAIQLHECGLIDTALKNEWLSLSTRQLATRFGWMDLYRSLQAETDRTRAPQRLLSRTITGYEAGVVGAQTVATLRGLPVETVVQELTEAGIEPDPAEVAWLTADELPDVNVDLSGLDEDPHEPAQ